MRIKFDTAVNTRETEKVMNKLRNQITKIEPMQFTITTGQGKSNQMAMNFDTEQEKRKGMITQEKQIAYLRKVVSSINEMKRTSAFF